MKNKIMLLGLMALAIAWSACNNNSEKVQGEKELLANRTITGTPNNSLLKDKNGVLVAEGTIKDGVRVGQWKFYVSPDARLDRIPDVQGAYNELGKKTGAWVHVNSFTEIGVRANFDDGVMNGECIYFDNSDNSILARGLVNKGIRDGKWIFYDQHSGTTGGYHKYGYKMNNKMSEGYYKNGLRIGKWEYDYFLDKNTHVKGALSFDNGRNNGRIEFYKVERHEKFGTEEVLSGVGEYKNGKKIGRWVEYNYGTKGDFIETGNYGNNGKRDGFWKVVIGEQTYNTSNFISGVANGPYQKYYPNGKLRKEGAFNMGLEEGAFKEYHRNGNVRKQGTFVLTDNLPTKDTIFYALKMPYEYHFALVEEDFADMHYDYVSWLDQPGWSIAPAELERRYSEFKTYGHSPNRRIVNVMTKDKSAVLTGDYMEFYENGSLHLKGKALPTITKIFDPINRQMIATYGRDGEWKEYDRKGVLKQTFVYKDGKLEQMLDGNGYVAHEFTYKNGQVSMDGKDITLNISK